MRAGGPAKTRGNKLGRRSDKAWPQGEPNHGPQFRSAQALNGIHVVVV